MRRIVIWLASTVTVVVLLFGYHTSTNRTAQAGVPASSSSGSASSSSGSSSSGSSASAPKVYTGDVAQTRWGPVQVSITVDSGKITAVAVPQSPNGNRRDEEINAQALPILIQDTVDAQGARIDMVSGATVTSEGYLESLQSAIDKAGI